MSEEAPVLGGPVTEPRKVEAAGIPFLRGELVDQAGMTVVVTDIPRNAPRFPKSVYLLVVVVDPASAHNGEAFVYRAGVRAQQSINAALTGDATVLDPTKYPGLQMRLTKAPMQVQGKNVVGIVPAPLSERVEITAEMKAKTDEILAGPPEEQA